MALYPVEELVDDRDERVRRNPPVGGMPHQLIEEVVGLVLVGAQVVLDPVDGDEPCLTGLSGTTVLDDVP